MAVKAPAGPPVKQKLQPNPGLSPTNDGKRAFQLNHLWTCQATYRQKQKEKQYAMDKSAMSEQRRKDV